MEFSVCTNSFYGQGINSVDTGRELNVHKTPRRRPGRLLNVLCESRFFYERSPKERAFGHVTLGPHLTCHFINLYI